MNDTETTTDTMADVSHTHPYTGETAGRLFNRGPTVAADGGKTEADGNGRTDTNRTMRDVDHTPPKAADDANRVFERGTEHDGRDDRETVVEDEE